MVVPERMVKCRILAPKAYLSKVINSLYDLGLYHITPHLKGEQALDIGAPLADAEELSRLLVLLRKILAKYPEISARHNDSSLMSSLPPLPEITSTVERAFAEVTEIEEKVQRLQQRQESVQGTLVALAILQHLNIDIIQLKRSKALTYFFGTIAKTEGLEEALQKVSDDCSLAKNSKYLLLVGRKEDEDRFTAVLQDFGYQAFAFDLDAGSSQKDIAARKMELKEIKEEQQVLERQHLALKSELSPLADLAYHIQEEIRKQELPLHFAVTKSSFVAEGWIPKADADNVKKLLESVTSKKISVVFSDPDHHESPPVKLKNKILVTPFEFLLRLYDLPKYQEIDPSSLLFLTFPLFFGIMLGDIGYGLVLLFVFLHLKKKIPALGQLASVLVFAAAVSIIFGFVFGEFFGFEHVSVETGEKLCDTLGICLPQAELHAHGQVIEVADFPRLLNRAHGHTELFGFEVLTILVIGAIIGFIHLNLGFLFGFINEYHHHGFMHAFLAKISWMVIEAGIIVAVLSKTGIFLPVMVWIGIALAVIGVVMLGKGEGIQGIVELPSLFSNMLSYMRLGAVGLASVGLAVVVNEELAMPFIEKGGVFILIGILIMLLGHGINILLGVIGPFLHGVRLHYVEFFSKFFQGGGKEYTPFTKSDKQE